jgi:hypothetical protein
LQFNAFAEHKQPTIAEREDDYRARRRKMIISPERNDPFAEGRLRLCNYVKMVIIHQQVSIECANLVHLCAFGMTVLSHNGMSKV